MEEKREKGEGKGRPEKGIRWKRNGKKYREKRGREVERNILISIVTYNINTYIDLMKTSCIKYEEQTSSDIRYKISVRWGRVRLCTACVYLHVRMRVNTQ